MGRPKRTSGPDTRNRLLQAAEQAFGAVGYQQARLADIAAAAGIRRSSLLYHFGTKEQLYREVVAATLGELRATLQAALVPHPAGTGTRLEAVTAALVSFSEQRRPALAMFVRELLDNPPSGTDNLRALANMLDLLEELVQAEAGALLPAGTPVRSLLVHVITSQALRIAAGPLGELLWGNEPDPQLLLRALVVRP